MAHDINFGFEFEFLSDPDGKVCSPFDIDGDHADRAVRTTLVLRDGAPIKPSEAVRPDG